MSKNAQDSQPKTNNLGKHAYAYKLNRINPDYANFELWAYCVGHIAEVISIVNAEEYLKQIERAFFYGEFCITLRGLTVEVPEKLLKQIRKDFEKLVSNRAGSVGNISPDDVSTSTIKTNTDRAGCLCTSNLNSRKSGGCRSLSDKPTHLSATATNRISTRNGRTSVVVARKTLTSNKGK